MILKIVTLFLVFIACLGIVGRLKLPRLPGQAKRCEHCKRPIIGKGPCPCRLTTKG